MERERDLEASSNEMQPEIGKERETTKKKKQEREEKREAGQET
jgi:hypothetical protein